MATEVGTKSPAHALIISGPPSDNLAGAIASACAGLLVPTSVHLKDFVASQKKRKSSEKNAFTSVGNTQESQTRMNVSQEKIAGLGLRSYNDCSGRKDAPRLTRKVLHMR